MRKSSPDNGDDPRSIDEVRKSLEAIIIESGAKKERFTTPPEKEK